MDSKMMSTQATASDRALITVPGHPGMFPRPSPLVLTLSIVALILLLLALLMPPGGQHSGDTAVKILQVIALTRHGTLAIGSANDTFSAIRPDSMLASPLGSASLIVQRGDEYYGIYSPFYTAIVSPFYWLFGTKGVILPGIISMIVLCWSLAVYADSIGIRRTWLLPIVVSFATPMLFYAYILSEHITALMFMSLALLAYSRKSWFVAGCLFCMSSILRPDHVLFVTSFIIALLIYDGAPSSWGPPIKVIAGFFMTAAPVMIIHLALFGNALGYHPNAAGQIELLKWNQLPWIDLAREMVQRISVNIVPSNRRLWLIGVTISLVIMMVLWRLRRSVASAFWPLAISPILAMSGAFGIVTASRVLWSMYAEGVINLVGRTPHLYISQDILSTFPMGVAAIATWSFVRTDERIRVLWIVGCLTVLLSIVVLPVDGAGAWGPRYLLTVYLPLVLLAVHGVNQAEAWAGKAAATLLVALSILVQCAGLTYLYATQRAVASVNAQLASLVPPNVVTTIGVLSILAAPSSDRIVIRTVPELSTLPAATADMESFWWISLDAARDRRSVPILLVGTEDPVLDDQYVLQETTVLSDINLRGSLYRVKRGDELPGR